MTQRRRRAGSFGYVISMGTSSHPSFAIRWREGKGKAARHKQKGGFRTKTDAMEALSRIRTGLGDGTLIQKRRAGVGFAQVAREWLELHSRATLRSHELNQMNYTKHVEPFFGDCPLSAVTATRILEFRAKLQAAGYAARTTNLMLALVRTILKFAASHGHIAASPTDRLGRGKLMLPIEKPKLAPPIEKAEDVGRLLEAIRKGDAELASPQAVRALEALAAPTDTRCLRRCFLRACARAKHAACVGPTWTSGDESSQFAVRTAA
jgi:hypothetical protein